MARDRARTLGGVVACILALRGVALGAPEIVYDNTTTPVSGDWFPDGFVPFSFYNPHEWMGDEITPAGTSRTVTQVEVICSSTSQVTVPAIGLALHKLDAENLLGSYCPGTLLWTGTLQNVVVDGPTPVTFDVPDIEVPDTFAWVTAGDSDFAGMAFYDPPTIGSSDDFAWDRDEYWQDWFALYFEADPIANFGARLWATPEPGTAALLIGGGCVVLRRRRRRRRTPPPSVGPKA